MTKIAKLYSQAKVQKEQLIGMRDAEVKQVPAASQGPPTRKRPAAATPEPPVLKRPATAAAAANTAATASAAKPGPAREITRKPACNSAHPKTWTTYPPSNQDEDYEEAPATQCDEEEQNEEQEEEEEEEQDEESLDEEPEEEQPEHEQPEEEHNEEEEEEHQLEESEEE
eukprot:10093251-Alexandrium_andersonii.AAC.1